MHECIDWVWPSYCIDVVNHVWSRAECPLHGFEHSWCTLLWLALSNVLLNMEAYPLSLSNAKSNILSLPPISPSSPHIFLPSISAHHKYQSLCSLTNVASLHNSYSLRASKVTLWKSIITCLSTCALYDSGVQPPKMCKDSLAYITNTIFKEKFCYSCLYLLWDLQCWSW